MTPQTPRIAVTDSVFPNLEPARAVLAGIGAEMCLASEPTPEAILRVAASADGLLVGYAKVTADMIRQMPQCRVISRFGIGVDNVDIEEAAARGIVVTRVPDYCLDEVSDHTLALLLALVRKIASANASVRAGRWEMPSVVPIHRLRGRVLGLVGFGRIPQLVAPKAKAFGLTVVAYDPFAPAHVFDDAGVEAVAFPQLLAISDVVSIHAPLVTETRGLFGTDVLQQMKPTAFLVNTARGPIVDEVALAQALDAGVIAGAALDVMTREPPVDSPLVGRDNVIITPHTSFYSEESLVDLQTKAAEEIVRVLTDVAPRHAVHPGTPGRRESPAASVRESQR